MLTDIKMKKKKKKKKTELGHSDRLKIEKNNVNPGI